MVDFFGIEGFLLGREACRECMNRGTWITCNRKSMNIHLTCVLL
jgi:hypothetical protein